APCLSGDLLMSPEPIHRRLNLHKQVFELNTNAMGQLAVSEIIRRNLLDDHLAMLRQRYKRKRDVMLEAIAAHWPREVRVNHPAGGFHLWCRLPVDLRAR